MNKENKTIVTEFKEQTRDTLVEKLVDYISAKAPRFSSEKHLDTSFSSLGLDSTDHVEMTAKIEDYLKITIEPTLAFDYPTVNSLADYLEQKFLKSNELEKEKG